MSTIKFRSRILAAIAIILFTTITAPTAAQFLSRQMLIHKLGLRTFSAEDPPPVCGNWRTTMPKYRDPEPYQKYLRARKFWRSKRPWNFTLEENRTIFKNVKEAAEAGDWGARILMLNFYKKGLGSLEKNFVLAPSGEEAMKIINVGVENGQAWAYYELGVAIEQGYGEIDANEEIALSLFLRASELGSPEAQMVLAGLYLSARRFDAVETMLKCAYSQGHGDAARKLAIHRKIRDDFAGYLRYSQDGIKFGSEESASSLMLFFSKGVWSRKTPAQQALLKQLGILPNEERAKRYEQISEALELNPDLRFTRIDQVVPLPPAELPEWKGITDALEPETDKVPAY